MSNKVTVLIIDDNASDRRIYRRFLKQMPEYDITVLEEDTGAGGIRACKDNKPDCVLLDYKLPDMDGLEVLPELHKTCKAPVLFITGQPEAFIIGKAHQKGAEAYLSKDNISSRLLQEKVRQVLNLS